MRWYSAYCCAVTVHQILIRVFSLLKDFSDLTLFLDIFSYSFHPTGLKHGGELDYEVMQRVVLSLQCTKF